MKTAREYLRVSHDTSGRLRSSEEQHEDNERVATGEGWALGGPYVEDGAVSASRYGRKVRPGFAALVGDLEAGRFGADVLILWEPSRGSRRLSEWARFLELLQDHGVGLHITSHGRTYDLASPRDRRSLHEDGTDSEYESGKISVRVKRAMAANAAAGRPHGRVLYGYRREYHLTPAGKRVFTGQVPDPDAAGVVRKIFADIDGGMTLKAITADLNTRGIKPAQAAEWKPTMVREIALNPSYIGLRAHNGEVTKGQWDGIINGDVYYRVHKLLTDPKRRTSRPGKTKHLLSMIARCGVCDGPMSVRYQREEAQYWCRDSGHVRIRQEDLDTFARRAIAWNLERPEEYAKMSRPVDSGALQSAQDDLAAIENDYQDAKRLWRQRKITASAFAEQEPQYLADIKTAEERIRELEAPPVLRMLQGIPGGTLAEKWANAPLATRRETVREMFDYIKVERAPVGGKRGPASERIGYQWRSLSVTTI